MVEEQFAKEHGLEMLTVYFDQSAQNLSISELEQVPDDIRRLVQIHKVPKGANHAYFTAHGKNEFQDNQITSYDIIYRHRVQAPDQRGKNKWAVDEFLGRYDRVVVRER